MSQEQESTISGNLYQVYSPSDQWYKENRMPRVGQKAKMEDGRAFVFCSTTADITAGQAVQAPAVLEETAIPAAVAAGAYEVGITQASVAANAYAGGMLVVILGTGNGYSYKIKKNTASGTADLVTITLYDPIKVALATTDDVTVVPLRSRGVAVGAADKDIVGVAMGTSTAATNSTTNYLWVQYKGIAYGQTCTVTAGHAIQSAASGAWGACDALTDVPCGRSIEPGATNGVVLLNLPE